MFITSTVCEIRVTYSLTSSFIYSGEALHKRLQFCMCTFVFEHVTRENQLPICDHKAPGTEQRRSVY